MENVIFENAFRSFGQCQGANLTNNMRNQIFGNNDLITFLKHVFNPFLSYLGGFALIQIRDSNGNLIFEEQSLSPKTVRPYMLINGKEDKKFMYQIGKRVDEEAEMCSELPFIFNDSIMMADCDFEPSFDGKLTRV